MTKRQRRAYVRARVQWRGLCEPGPAWGSAGELRRSCARWLSEAAGARATWEFLTACGRGPVAAQLAEQRRGGAWFSARTAGECAAQLRARFGAGVGLPS